MSPLKTSLIFLFRLGAIFSMALLALVGISLPPGTAGATPDPASFDILGMKLGMSVEEIEAAIKAYNPSLPVLISRPVIADKRLGDGNVVVQFVNAGGVPTAAYGMPPERIAVGFTVSQPSRAFYIGRMTRFPPDQRPLIDKTVQQLREKYGSESRSVNNGIGFEWVFDKAGKQIAASMPLFQTCAHIQIPNLATFLGYYGIGESVGASGSPRFYAPECSIAFEVALIRSTNPQVLSDLNEQLVGDSIAVDDIQKLMAKAKAEQERQRQQQEQKASGVKPPL
jgi:hypothetical protein